VPSFSSKGFQFFDDESGVTRSEVSHALALTGPHISDSMLLSAYDIWHGYLDRPDQHYGTKELVILDSGGYELSPEWDSTEPKQGKYKPAEGYGAEQYLEVLAGLPGGAFLWSLRSVRSALPPARLRDAAPLWESARPTRVPARQVEAVERAITEIEQRRKAAARALRVSARDAERDAAAVAAVERVDELARNVVFLARHSTQLSLEQVVMMSEVAATAVWALVMRDRLESADFAILYWPFAAAFPVAELEASR
jgi:hypothetical protein